MSIGDTSIDVCVYKQSHGILCMEEAIRQIISLLIMRCDEFSGLHLVQLVHLTNFFS